MSGVVLADHDPNWSADFAREARAIAACLCPDATLHHIGSTAVPGLAAKPIIDILGVVADPCDIDVLPLLERGYVDRGAQGIEGRRFLARGPKGARSHHLHLYPEGHSEIARHLAFRDRLRESGEDAAAYAAVKRDAAQSAPDRGAYTDMKSEIIARILGGSTGSASRQ